MAHAQPLQTLVLLGLAACAPPDSGPPIALADEPQYLAFALQTDLLGDGAGDPVETRTKVADAADVVLKQVGAKGDGQSRLLTVYTILPAWIPPGHDALIQTIAAQTADVALEKGIAFAFTIETHYFWGPRTDLWNFWDPHTPGFDPANAANVEWSDWDGTPVHYRYIDWGAPQKLDAPHMCYLSATIQSEVARIGAVYGAAIQAASDRVAAAGHPEYFAGVTVTSEPSLDNYTNVDTFDPKMGALMMKNGDAKVRLGYCSLTALGYTKDAPPESLGDAAAEVNRRFISSWADALVAGGLPATRLYTHVAASAEGAATEFMNAPISIAFIDSARPGWTTYPVGALEDGLDPLTQALADHGDPHWAGAEAAPINGMDPYAYLRQHFDSGAVLMVMNTGATGGADRAFHKAVLGHRAIVAYQRFLSLE